MPSPIPSEEHSWYHNHHQIIYQSSGKTIIFAPMTQPIDLQKLSRNEICFDHEFSYPDYENYHGPSNLAHIHSFIAQVNQAASKYSTVRVCTDGTSPQCNNAICLIAFYLMLQEGLSPENAFKQVSHLPLQPFLGIGVPPNPEYAISLLDILQGFQKMLHAEPGILQDFDAEAYTLMEAPVNGDANWIIPGKILAMAGPKPLVFPPQKALPFFQRLGVKTVIRLNRKHYTKADLPGISLFDLFMKDGSNPSNYRLGQFMRIMRNRLSKGAVAVHCRAGLGRTGSLICAYLMSKYGLSANQAIGFIRVMRPGSILCDQPSWLRSLEPKAPKSTATSSIKRRSKVMTIKKHSNSLAVV